MGVVLTVGGTLIMVASLPHAFLGWPALRDALPAQTSPEVVRTAAIGWLFGSFAMATLGLVAMVSAAHLRRGVTAARSQALVVGAGYILFAAWALWYDDGNPHFIGFMVMGAAVVSGAWIAGRVPRG